MVHHSFDSGKTRKHNDKRRWRCRFIWNWNKHRNNLNTEKATIKFQNPIEKLLVSIEGHNVNSVVDLLSSSQAQGQENEKVVAVNRAYSECFSMTLLHVAVDCSENNTEIVEVLLKAGGDPNNVNVEAGLSPLHLSVMLDYDRVLGVLLQYGGEPAVLTPDGRDCYFLAVQNVQEQMKDKCYNYFAKTSEKFRESFAGSELHSSSPKTKVSCSITPDSGGGDEFFSCDDSINQKGVPELENVRLLNDIPGRFFPVNFDFECETTEDESSVSTSQEEGAGMKLTTDTTTKHNESGLEPQSSTPSSPRENANGSSSSPSCLEVTPPIIPQPTKAEIEMLREQMKKLNIPVTPSTYAVISKCAENQSLLEMILQPKVGTCNFSSELRHGIQNLNLIEEWGNQKIDFLLENNHFATTNNHKIFNNYLLLDPKIINENGTFFSGEQFKSVMGNSEKFETFLRSVFYIGKAHDGRRPMQHLIEAKTKHNWRAMGRSISFGEKVDRILKIWSSGMGVLIVSVFHHSTEREANVREACMIDAIGLIELSNQKKGSYGGVLASQKMKNQLGTLLLYKSFCSFIVNDPKQFYPQDF